METQSTAVDTNEAISGPVVKKLLRERLAPDETLRLNPHDYRLELCQVVRWVGGSGRTGRSVLQSFPCSDYLGKGKSRFYSNEEMAGRVDAYLRRRAEGQAELAEKRRQERESAEARTKKLAQMTAELGAELHLEVGPFRFTLAADPDTGTWVPTFGASGTATAAELRDLPVAPKVRLTVSEGR